MCLLFAPRRKSIKILRILKTLKILRALYTIRILSILKILRAFKTLRILKMIKIPKTQKTSKRCLELRIQSLWFHLEILERRTSIISINMSCFQYISVMFCDQNRGHWHQNPLKRVRIAQAPLPLLKLVRTMGLRAGEASICIISEDEV